MFNRPKVNVLSPHGASPKRLPFSDIQNISPHAEVSESKGLDNFDWNRKLNLKKVQQKKKFVVEVAEDKGNDENSCSPSTTEAAFGRRRRTPPPPHGRLSRKNVSEVKDTEDEDDAYVSYQDSSPRYEEKDVQHENLLRIAHSLSPKSSEAKAETSPSGVKGPPSSMVSPKQTPLKSRTSQLLVGSPLLNVTKREIEMSPQTPDMSVSPSDQKTPPEHSPSPSLSLRSDSKDTSPPPRPQHKLSPHHRHHHYSEDAHDHQYDQYDANYDFSADECGGPYGEGADEYTFDDCDDDEHDDQARGFEITSQECYVCDSYHEAGEEKQAYDDESQHTTTTTTASLNALTPVRLRVTRTVEVTDDEVDSPLSTSSAIADHTDYDIEQLFSKVRHNRMDEVKVLLRQGTSARLKDSNGNSLLHICAQNNLRKMASLVLEHGADINAENKKGTTPLDYCDNYHFDQLGEWFVQNGGDNGHTNLLRAS